ncbi:MFS transporter [Candidatus Micrarchaeota archaeon]|nr:MFS transporter [Candidatus Micrarchaeota archaeon]
MIEQKYRTIFLIVILDLMGIGIIFPLLPFYAANFNSDPIMIGLILALYPIMQFFFAPVLGHFSDKYGRKPILIISLLGSAVGYLILGLATNIWMLFIARIIDGATGGNISTAQAHISDISDEKDRRKAMGMIGMAFGIGFMLGPLVGGFLGHFNPSYPGFFAGFLALVSAGLVHFTLKESKREIVQQPLKPSIYIDVLRDEKLRPFFLTSFVFPLAAASAFFLVDPLFVGKVFGYTEAEIGVLFGFIGLISIFVQGFVIRKLDSKFSDIKLIKIGLVATLLSFVALAGIVFIPALAFPLLVVSTLITPFGHGLVFPTIKSYISKSGKETGKLMGDVDSYISIANAIGPILGGVIFSIGLNTPFIFGGIVVALLLGVLHLGAKERVKKD